MASDKQEGLDRVSRIESTTQKKGNSGEPWGKNRGPAAGGSLGGNPTSSGKIRRG